MDARPYQLECIEAAREHIRAGARKLLVVAPTGSGKTVVASIMIAAATAKGSRVLFLAHRKELLEQTLDKLGRFGVRAGLIQGQREMELHHQVQVASVPTLVRRLHLELDFELVFVDEAHHTAANSYQQILAAFPRALVIGLTATPWREDGQGLGDLFDAHVLAATPVQLRDQGYLVPVAGWAFVPISTASAKVERGDFVGKTMEAAATSAKVVGNIVAEWQARAGGVRTVLFGCTVAHSQAMAQAFRTAGVAAEHVDGKTKPETREAILRRIRSGATRVLCNVNVLTEGFDCPELECAILARPTLSTTLALQMVGRVLRTCEGKQRALLFDHAGVLRAHGHPYSERDFSPQRSANVTRAAAEGREATRTRRCPKCESFLAGWPCVGCGYQPPEKELPEHVAGEAVAIAESPAWQAAMAKEAQRGQRQRHFENTSAASREAAFFAAVRRKNGNIGQAVGWYRWWSGETAWPERAWRAEAEEGTR